MHDRAAEERLLAGIKSRLPELEKLLDQARSEWHYEDFVYRFYHHSFKVFGVQRMTAGMVAALRELLPERELNRDFLAIIEDGTGKAFEDGTNDRWLDATRPLIEAFFHARYMLEMAVKFGRVLDEPTDSLPSGWAALLYLYDLR